MSPIELVNTKPGTIIKGFRIYRASEPYVRLTERVLGLNTEGWVIEEGAVRLDQAVIDWYPEEVVDRQEFVHSDHILGIRLGQRVPTVPVDYDDLSERSNYKLMLSVAANHEHTMERVEYDQPLGMFMGRFIVAYDRSVRKSLTVFTQILTKNRLGWICLTGDQHHLLKPMNIT